MARGLTLQVRSLAESLINEMSGPRQRGTEKQECSLAERSLKQQEDLGREVAQPKITKWADLR